MAAARLMVIITQSELGGAQKYVHTLATRLPGERFAIQVVCGPGGPLIEQLRAAGIAVHIVPSLVREIDPRQDWRAFRQLCRLIRDWHPQIVHTNSSKAGLLGRAAAWVCRTPAIIYTAHGFVLSEPLGTSTRALYWGAEKVGALVGDRTIAVSECDRRLAMRYRLTTAKKIATIPNGIDPWSEPQSQQVGAEARAAVGLPAAGPLIGTVANFYPTKGLRYFIEACALVRERRPDAHFVLIGDGEEAPTLRDLTDRRGLGSAVAFLGRRADAARLMGLFDIFVMSSIKEGLPFALLEAMRLGRPIVATRVGGIPETLGAGADRSLVPPGDPVALAGAILTLLEDPATARAVGAAARQRVEAEFSSARMVTATANLYEQVLADAHTRRQSAPPR